MVGLVSISPREPGVPACPRVGGLTPVLDALLPVKTFSTPPSDKVVAQGDSSSIRLVSSLDHCWYGFFAQKSAPSAGTAKETKRTEITGRQETLLAIST